jgi:hypothetical protein
MLRQGGTAGELPPESRANLQQAQSLDTDGSAEITLDRFRHLGEAASAA